MTCRPQRRLANWPDGLAEPDAESTGSGQPADSIGADANTEEDR